MAPTPATSEITAASACWPSGRAWLPVEEGVIERVQQRGGRREAEHRRLPPPGVDFAHSYWSASRTLSPPRAPRGQDRGEHARQKHDHHEDAEREPNGKHDSLVGERLRHERGEKDADGEAEVDVPVAEPSVRERDLADEQLLHALDRPVQLNGRPRQGAARAAPPPRGSATT